MSDDTTSQEYIAWSPNWEAEQLEKLIERATSYDRVTKDLLDSFSFREDPFPGIAKIRCVAEEVGISARGGIMTCLPEDKSLLGEDGMIVLEVFLDQQRFVQATRALFISLEEEFITAPVSVVGAEGQLGLWGFSVNPFSSKQKSLVSHFRISKAVTWHAAKIFCPFVLIKDGYEFDLFIGKNANKAIRKAKKKRKDA